ncbi:MAG: carboxypeptidase regulatory-like domain-containing protein [Candidatus Thorarchaeota archaeon]
MPISIMTIVIADMSRIPGSEIVAISTREVVVLNSDGEPSWSYRHSSGSTSYPLNTPAVSDINGNGVVDVCFGDSLGRIEVRDGGGIILHFNVSDSAPLYTMGIYHSPIIADLDDDGYLDIFVVGGEWASANPENNYGRAFAFKGTGGTGEGWPMDKHDVRNSGCFEGYADVVMISGHVEDYHNNTAIAGARVGTMGGNLFVTTDETGNFSRNLYPGLTAITVEAEGYDSGIRTVRILAEEGQFFEFRLLEESTVPAPVVDPIIDGTLSYDGTLFYYGTIVVGTIIVVMVLFRKIRSR